LISRQRMVYEPSVASFIGWKVITEPLTFIMEQKMLRTLKARTESVYFTRSQTVLFQRSETAG